MKQTLWNSVLISLTLASASGADASPLLCIREFTRQPWDWRIEGKPGHSISYDNPSDPWRYPQVPRTALPRVPNEPLRAAESVRVQSLYSLNIKGSRSTGD